MTSVVSEWFTEALDKDFIAVYEFREFTNVKFNGETSGEGRFSQVASADWNYTNRKVALKRLKNFDLDKLALEVRLHRSGHLSKNVIRFLGLTQENPGSAYIMVMEYGDMKCLREFLQRGLNLTWDLKTKISLDIAKGLDYLHVRNIAHRDLHSNNIVINQIHPCNQREYIAKITDFGAARVMNDTSEDTTQVIGQIPFTDPQFLNDRKNYKKNLRSDIYSLGVIFWEISANEVPFSTYVPESRGDFRDLCLTIDIICGFREEPAFLTPEPYKKLYQNCWEYDPVKRPIIGEVINSLNNIIMARPLEQTITAGQ